MRKQILALLSFAIVLSSFSTVEAATYDSFIDAIHGDEDAYDNDLIDLDDEVDKDIALKIIGPSKIVIHDGDKLTKEDLLAKFKSSRRNTEITLNKDKCYWIANDGKTKIYMNGKTALVIDSQCNGFDPTFVDIPQHLVIEAKSCGETVSKKVTLIVKHNTVKKVNKYIYMRCDANLHESPNYQTKNLGKIKYNTKVKAIEIVKVGEYNWYKIKYKNKVGYIFASNASSKKLHALSTIKNGIIPVEDTKADITYEKYNTAEYDREHLNVDHNGKKPKVYGGFSSSSKD